MKKFAKVGEKEITSAIIKDFCEGFLENVETDVIIVGGGPSGLVAGMRLARDGFKVLMFEANNYLGGGFWMGGYLMNAVTVREPAQEILDEIGVPYKKATDGLYLTGGPHVTSKLIASACDAGIKVVNMTKVDDVVLRENNRVSGVVINWTPVSSLPRAISCIDPVAVESRLVIDATGHDACVASTLEKRGILKLKGYGPMWVEKSEDLVVEKTGEIHPGLIAAGMAVSTVFGIPRMGPTFGSMLLSGEKAAIEAKKILISKSVDKTLKEEVTA